MTEEERYAKVETDKQNALNQSNQMYDELLNSNSQLAQQQKDYIANWQTTQNEIADKNATYQTELQNQNKVKAEKEFQNEAIASKNAYYDFINPYGAQAEIQAQNGLNNTGYSETTKARAWNAQQNRTAQARSTMNNAIQQYDNAIKEIELNRDTTKSQYALQALQQQLDAALQEFNNASQIKQNQLSNNQALDSEYNTRYDTVWNQINTEKQQAEAIRQYEQNYALQKQQYEEDIRQFDENIAYLKEKDAKEYELQIKQLEEQKRQAQQQQANWEKEYALSKAKTYSSINNNYGYEVKDTTTQIKTKYYSGNINPDTQYGVFNTEDSNGIKYQPDNVGGNKLKSVGKVSDYFGTGNTGKTGANIDNQKLWSTNGKYYIWDGSQNSYIDVTSQMK